MFSFFVGAGEGRNLGQEDDLNLDERYDIDLRFVMVD